MKSHEATQSRINDAIDRLVEEFSDSFKQETVRRFASDSVSAYAGARVTEFVPLLLYRSTRERLTSLARSRDRDGESVPQRG
jgi:protein-tyrosine phosphatase-like protein